MKECSRCMHALYLRIRDFVAKPLQLLWLLVERSLRLNKTSIVLSFWLMHRLATRRGFVGLAGVSSEVVELSELSSGQLLVRTASGRSVLGSGSLAKEHQLILREVEISSVNRFRILWARLILDLRTQKRTGTSSSEVLTLSHGTSMYSKGITWELVWQTLLWPTSPGIAALALE